MFLLTVAAVGAAVAAASRSASVPSRQRARVAFGAGWLLYACAQVMSGLVLGWPRGVLLGVRVAALVVIAAVSVAAHAEASLKGFRRLALVLGLLTVSEVVAAASRLDAGTPGWVVAEVLGIAGGLALAAWLSRAFGVSIQYRFVSAFVSLLIIVVVLISSVMTQVFASNIRSDALARAQTEAKSLSNTLRAGYGEARARAGILAQLPGIGTAVAGRDPGLADVAAGLQAPEGPFGSSDFIAFLAPGGGLLAVSAKAADGRPTMDALDVASLPGTNVVQRALGKQASGGMDVVGGKLVLVGAAPVYRPSAPGQLVGVVSVGTVLSTAYLESLPGNTSQEITLVTADSVVATTLPGHPAIAAVAPGSALARIFDGRAFSAEGTLGGTDYFNGYMPLERADQPGWLGALVVHQPSQVAVLVQENVGRRLLLLALAATLVAVGLAYLVGARIVQPIVTLTQAAERVRLGDLTTRVEAQGSGEVGVLSSAFNQMTEAIGGLTSAFKEAAEEEFRLRSRLETILQSMTDGVIAADTDGTIVAFNREAERMIGIEAARAVGRPVDDVLVVEDPSGARIPLLFDGPRRDSVRGMIASLSRTTRPGTAGEGAGAIRTPVVVTTAGVFDEAGNAMGLVAVVRDLTPEIEVERMKTEFLSNVSHELRTPLTPIKGYANLMIRRDVSRTQAVGFLERIVESTDRLERIVGMLVDFSAMEAGRLVPKAVPVHLGQVVEDLLGRWKAVSAKHSFERTGFAGLPPLHLDQRLVPRAIDELIDNAVKFSPDGGRVVVSALLDGAAAGAGSRLVRITVSDEGIGIAEERIAGLSGGFVQVDASETREYGGLGLGLAYVRRIAESHGGYLEEPQSKPGKGSSFTIVLPVGLVDTSVPVAPASAGPGSQAPGGADRAGAPGLSENDAAPGTPAEAPVPASAGRSEPPGASAPVPTIGGARGAEPSEGDLRPPTSPTSPAFRPPDSPASPGPAVPAVPAGPAGIAVPSPRGEPRKPAAGGAAPGAKQSRVPRASGPTSRSRKRVFPRRPRPPRPVAEPSSGSSQGSSQGSAKPDTSGGPGRNAPGDKRSNP